LKPCVGTPAYATLCQAVHDAAVDAVTNSLPNPGALTGAALRGAAEKDASVEEVQLFQWLFPGLVVNVAFFRGQVLPTTRRLR
jgi:hypothetical protein